MQRFNFNQLGGFPLTQDRLKWMQDGYIDAINALGSVVDSEEPVVLSGVELVAGGWVHGEVSDGWVYHPDAGVVPFIGGVFTANNRSYGMSIFVVTNYISPKCLYLRSEERRVGEESRSLWREN